MHKIEGFHLIGCGGQMDILNNPEWTFYEVTLKFI
jgi:hypothetical protein